MFARYSLRTTDQVAARRFYAAALGLALPDGASPETCLEAWTLHEQARRNGAPAHWLGHVEVDDLDRALGELLAAGGQTFGPPIRTQAASWAVLRDPFGAVVALRARGEAPPDRPVAWHQLHTTDLERAWSLYAQLAGWRDAGTLADADVEGGHRLFAWGDAPAGSIASTARLPAVHPHWLFYFPVRALDVTLESIRAHGGTALPPVARDGARFAACEDPQGGAFGVMETSR